MTLRRAVAGLVALMRRRRLDRELEDEILAHIELAERDALARGLAPEEARCAARRAFGGIEQVKEEHRDQRSLRWIETLLRDFRYGLASLRRDPVFAVAAIGVLALGIGANTAMFSIVDAVLLKPLPYPEPERMVSVNEAEGAHRWGVSTLNFVDWKRLNTVFTDLAAEHPDSAATMMNGEPTRLLGRAVSADYFRVFGVEAQLGRTFAPGEDQPGAAHVVVLSHSAWQQRFGGASDILNRDLLLDGEPHRVVGVLPAGSFDRVEAVYWKPLVFTPAEQTRESLWLVVVGRLRRGVSLGQAQQEMTKLSAQLAGLNPFWKKGWSAAVDPYGRQLVASRLRQSIYVAFGAVLMVLLIACSNVANLLLARGATRTREMAVRAALGASRGRLVGQLLAESLALCVLGGAAGIALAYGLLRAARPLLVLSLPATAEVGLNPLVLAFAAAIVLGVSLLVGILPSLRASSGTLSAFLNQATRGSSGSRAVLRRIIVIGEVAVSLLLICGASLLFRSLLNLQNGDAGVRIENVIATSVELPDRAYPTPESAVHFSEAVVERLESMPGVERAAVATDVPLEGVNETEVIVAPGLYGTNVSYKRVDPHYFSTFDIPILSGRGIGERDRQGAPPVVVVNQELAARVSQAFGVADPVGRTIGISHGGYVGLKAELTEYQIVGVIRSEQVGNLRDPGRPVVYVPIAQMPRQGISLIVRTRGEATAAVSGIREAVRQVDPRLPLGTVTTMAQVKERSFTDTTHSAWVIGAFAMVAALLAAFGLYGVLAQSVTQQRREIGIRMALGAGPREIVSGVVRNAMAMIAVGLAIGLAGAFALTGVMKSLLFQVSAFDPAAFAIACASMALVGLVAVFLPASRAARVDPVTTLRDEG